MQVETYHLGTRKRKYRVMSARAQRSRTAAMRRRGAFRGIRTYNKRNRALNRRVGGFLGIETKFYDTSLISAALTAPSDSTGGLHNPSATIALNTVTAGTGESQRDGNAIMMKKISIYGSITSAAQVNATASDDAGLYFIALVLDKNTNAAVLTSQTVFTNPSASGRLAACPFHNLQYTERYKVLATIKMTAPQSILTWDGTNMEQSGWAMSWEMHVNLHDIRVKYTNTTETIANIPANSLSIIAWCSNTGAVPLLNYHSRLRFVG